MESKYKITVRYLEGSSEMRVGIGKPLKRDNEILVNTPDGKEVVFITDNIKSLLIEPYTED